MEERRDYAVLRFVDQNGWSYMVNDYAKGCSLMEYIKQGIRVEKETVFDWIRQLSKQLEQYYRCGNEDAAYGYVNPYAVIITEDGMLCLLDINEPENEELLKQMKKKKLPLRTRTHEPRTYVLYCLLTQAVRSLMCYRFDTLSW